MMEPVHRPEPTSLPSVSLDDTAPDFRQRPHPVFDELRRLGRVHKDDALDRLAVLTAADVDAVLSDRSWSSDPFKGRPTAFGRRGVPDSDRGSLSMVFLDDPEHARLRGLVASAFTPRAIAALRPRIEIIADRLLDRIDPRAPFDLIAEYATPLPTLVIAEMLGIDDGDVAQFKLWSDDSALIFSDREDARSRVRAAREGLNAVFRHLRGLRRSTPRDDLVSALVAAEAGSDRLSETELLNTCRLLLVAGNITTTDLIGNGTVVLLQHPDQVDRLRDRPDLWPAAVEEILRFDPPVTRVNRQTSEARELGGCPMEAGQTATAMLLAANHDPALHADPHRFDIGRVGQKHFSFGHGAHHCLGAPLARSEALIALSKLFERFPALRRTPGREATRKDIPALNGFDSVWLDAGP